MSNRIDHLLRKRGLKTIADKSYSAKGTAYTFDNSFIEAFDKYLSGTPSKDMTKSQLNNIKLYIEFADGNISDQHTDYETLVECDKYLATLGV